MNQVFKIEGVPLFTQRDNAIAPYVSCFPTSCAMAMQYCLNQINKTKEYIGCGENTQLEDYINQAMDSTEVTKWMKENEKSLGGWIWKTPRRQILAVETFVFNLLMKGTGFLAEAKTTMTFDSLCNHIETVKLPAVISGDFSSVSRVKGHIVCVTGFNKVGIREFIINDPYGNALKGYDESTQAEEVHYGEKFFTKDSKGSLWCMILKQEG